MRDCPSCSRKFSSTKGLRIHHTKVHGEKLGIETTECEACGQRFEYYPKGAERGRFCSAECASPADDEDWKKSISDSIDRDSISKRMSKDNPMEGVTGADHPCSFPSGGNVIKVEETGHVVRSTWEARFDRYLYKTGLDYEYEPRAFDCFEYTYWPDFVIDDEVVVEIKGYANEADLRRSYHFKEAYPDYRYVVVQGDGPPLPADEWYDWYEFWEELETDSQRI